MSSFFAIVSTDLRAVDQDLPDRMMTSLAFLGSERFGVWRDEQVALGQHLFVTTPQARQEQTPTHDAEAQLTLAWDGRIDNRDELAVKLGFDAAIRNEAPDSLFVLAAYKKWQQRCVDHLVGDFAFAIWDARCRQLFCARDSQGLRPLYYRSDAHKVLIASDVQALLEAKDMPRRADMNHVEREILNQNRDHNSTHFEGIYRLCNASALLVKDGKVKTWRWWKPSFRAIRYKTDAEYGDHYRDLLQQAVGVRLRSIGSISADLSGGLDSASVVCHGTRLLASGNVDAESDRMQTYALALAEYDRWPKPDERERIEMVLAQEDVDHHYVVNQDYDFSSLLDGCVKDYRGGPLHIGGGYAKALEMRRDAGCRVNLMGQGGDEATTSEAVINYFDFIYRLRPDLIWRDIKRYQADNPDLTLRNIAGIRIKGVLNQTPPRGDDAGLSHARDKHHVATDGLIRKRIVNLGSNRNRLAGLPLTIGRDVYNNIMKADYSQLILLQKIMGIDARLPMRDQRLVEFVMRVPAEIQRQGRWGRRLVRLAGQDILPTGVQWNRDKDGSTQPDLLRFMLQSRDRTAALTKQLEKSDQLNQLIDFSLIRQNLAELPNTPNPNRHEPVHMGKTMRAVKTAWFLQRQGLL